jgi:DNA-binding winged helix-turn-helix (wHTH) protein/Tol biopolymer transport system component
MKTLMAKQFRFADFELDGMKRLLLKQGKPVALNSKTFDLLLTLVENHGEVLSKNELLERVWPGQFVEEGNLTVQISILRKIFGERKDEHRFIVTVPGKGYSFVAGRTDEGDREIIVESHRLSRVVIEEQETEAAPAGETNGHQPEALETASPALLKAAAHGRRTAKNVWLVTILLIGAAFAGVAGYWLYQRQNRRTSLAESWLDPTRAVKPRQLTNNGKVSLAALSPDGNYFAYVTGQTDKPSLWYAHTNGKQQAQIRPPEAVAYHGLTFAPDGDEVYYVTGDDRNANSSLFRIPVLGGPPQKVAERINSAVTFSADGRQIAFIRQAFKRKLSILVVADAETGANERELATRPIDKRFTIRGISWSPDGKRIAVGVVSGNRSVDEDIFLVDAETGATEKFGTETWQQVRRVSWLKDGSGLFVNAIEKNAWDDRHLWLLEYPGGQIHKITQDLFHYGMFSLSLSNDGAKLLSVSSKKICHIFTSPANNLSQATKITTNSLGRRDGSEGLAWTADGKIVFSTFFDKSQMLWVMEPDGTNARQLTSAGFVDRLPIVTPDNRYVLFSSTRGGQWHLWRVRPDGSELKQLAATGDSFRGSSDGKWVFYRTRTNEGVISIWKIPIDGGEPVRLTGKALSSPSVSPDGKMFAAAYNRSGDNAPMQLAIFPVDGDEPLHVFDVPPKTNFDTGVNWMPDGQSLVYRDFGPGLWRQRLTGGAPEKILEFPDEIIYDFGWSFDGRQFAVAHGEDVRDVVLITNDQTN